MLTQPTSFDTTNTEFQLGNVNLHVQLWRCSIQTIHVKDSYKVIVTWRKDINDSDRNIRNAIWTEVSIPLWLIGECNKFRQQMYQIHYALVVRTCRQKSKPMMNFEHDDTCDILVGSRWERSTTASRCYQTTKSLSCKDKGFKEQPKQTKMDSVKGHDDIGRTKSIILPTFCYPRPTESRLSSPHTIHHKQKAYCYHL